MFNNLQEAKAERAASAVDIAPTDGNDDAISRKSAPPGREQTSAYCAFLPDLQIDASADFRKSRDMVAEMDMAQSIASLPSETKNELLEAAEDLNHVNGLDAPFDNRTRQALMKDADLYPPVKNADGSTTYSVIQIGLTDRNVNSGASYYSRKIDVTVPDGPITLNDCRFNFSERETISEQKYTELLKRDQAASPDINIFTHGVFCSAQDADRQALMLDLSNGRPTLAIDYTSNPVGSNPIKLLIEYQKDTADAKRVNNDPNFTAAIDKTVQQIGADHTGLIGFSHGGMFDARYLKHRVESHLPKVNTVVLAHPDLPISDSALLVGDKMNMLGESARRPFVIGSPNDLALKVGDLIGHLPGTTTYEYGKSEQRLGDYSWLSRAVIGKEGAESIKERDDHEISGHHFINFAGIAQIFDDTNLSEDQIQVAYNQATDDARQNPQMIAQIQGIADGLSACS